MIMELYHFVCILVPITIYEILLIMYGRGGLRSPLHYKKKYLCRHLLETFFMCIYLNLVLKITGIGTIWDIKKYQSLNSLELNLIPFSDFKQVGIDIPNIILFLPLGFILPSIWKNMRNPIKSTFLGFCFSLLIELCQLFNYRVTDINDLIYNTIGTLIGYLIWKISRKIFPFIKLKRISLSRKEPAIIVFIVIAAIFLFYNQRASFDSNALLQIEIDSQLDEDSLLEEWKWDYFL